MTGLLLGLAAGLLVAALAAIWQGIAVLFLILLGGIGDRRDRSGGVRAGGSAIFSIS